MIPRNESPTSSATRTPSLSAAPADFAKSDRTLSLPCNKFSKVLGSHYVHRMMMILTMDRMIQRPAGRERVDKM